MSPTHRPGALDVGEKLFLLPETACPCATGVATAARMEADIFPPASAEGSYQNQGVIIFPHTEESGRYQGQMG